MFTRTWHAQVGAMTALIAVVVSGCQSKDEGPVSNAPAQTISKLPTDLAEIEETPPPEILPDTHVAAGRALEIALQVLAVRHHRLGHPAAHERLEETHEAARVHLKACGIASAAVRSRLEAEALERPDGSGGGLDDDQPVRLVGRDALPELLPAHELLDELVSRACVQRWLVSDDLEDVRPPFRDPEWVRGIRKDLAGRALDRDRILRDEHERLRSYGAGVVEV